MNTPHDNSSRVDALSHRDSVITGLWSNYGTVRKWLNARIPNSIARQTDVDDVMQEAFAEACRTVDKLADKESTAARNWLSLVARRKLIDRVRHVNAKRRSAAGDCNVSAHEVEIPAMVATPSSFVARREAKELLAIALGQLAERHQTVIRLRFFEDRTFADVAQQMEISVEAAQMLSRRALRNLKKTLGERSRIMPN